MARHWLGDTLDGPAAADGGAATDAPGMAVRRRARRLHRDRGPERRPSDPRDRTGE